MKMKNNFETELGVRGLTRSRKAAHGRTEIIVLCIVVVIGAAAAYWLISGRRSHSSTTPQGSSAGSQVRPDSTAAKSPAKSTSSSPSAQASKAPAAPVEATPAARQLVAALSQIQPGQGPLTQEQATAWKQTLQQLADQRAAAVPAIGEFLAKNTDVRFESESDLSSIGFPSLRVALLQTMHGIGGPQALAVSLQILQTAADPVEIATLTKYLEQSDPAKYRQAELTAAHEALAQAASGKWDSRDVSPLMEVLKQYGGAGTAADLQNLGNNWFIYTPIVLAQLPDGSGVPALLAWVKKPDAPVLTGTDMYLRMLAQVSAQHPEAFEALVEQASANRIPNSAWNGIAASLGGSMLELDNPVLNPGTSLTSQTSSRRVHIASGNQNFLELPPPDGMTPLQAADRVRMLDRLLSSTTNQTALQALQKVRVELSAKAK